MRNPPETDRGYLLDVTLADENWQAFNQSLCARATASFCGSQRRRRWQSRALQAALVAVLIAGGIQSLRHPALSVAPVSPATVAPQASALGVHLVNEQELLAMFPKGSCVIAEINGQKELVLLEPEVAARGFRFVP